MTISKEQNFTSQKFDVTSYIKDGLVGLWDCQNNVGIGQYNQNFNGVTNLVTGKQLTVVDYMDFRIGFPYAHGGRTAECRDDGVLNAFCSNFTCEFAFGFEEQIGIGGLIRILDQNSRNIIVCNMGTDGKMYIAFSDYVAKQSRMVTPYTNHIICWRSTGNHNDIFFDGELLGNYGPIPEILHVTQCYIFGFEISYAQYRRLISSRVYSRALSDEELEHNFKVDKMRFGI